MLGMLGMLVWLGGRQDGGGLWQDSGLVQPPQSGEAGSCRAGGQTGSLGCPDSSDGRVGVQDQPGQRLGQIPLPHSILHIWHERLQTLKDADLHLMLQRLTTSPTWWRQSRRGRGEAEGSEGWWWRGMDYRRRDSGGGGALACAQVRVPSHPPASEHKPRP